MSLSADKTDKFILFYFKRCPYMYNKLYLEKSINQSTCLNISEFKYFKLNALIAYICMSFLHDY